MIYLASRSPRRLALLEQIGITDVRLLLDEDEARAEALEAVRPRESPTHYVERVARAKAEAAWARLLQLSGAPHPGSAPASISAENEAVNEAAKGSDIAIAAGTQDTRQQDTRQQDTPQQDTPQQDTPRHGLPDGHWPLAPLLAADTTVAVGGRILGKPADAEDAARILGMLSGRSHRVLSSVVVVNARGKIRQRTQVSRVRFRRLTDEDLEAYLASGEPFGKAGASGIQGRAAAFVKKLEGSYSGVMGLPLFETAELLGKAMKA